MIKEGKFGVHEAVWLIVITISSKVFFSSPTVLSSLVGNTGWYSTIISASVALVGFMIVYLLLKRFPETDIMDIYNITLGKIIGFIFSMILALVLMFITVVRISEFHEVMKVYVFPLSPDWYVTGIFIVCIAALSIYGLESIARFSTVIVYFFIAGFFIVLIMGLENYDVNNLFPIFGYGLDKILYHGVVRSSVYGEVIILAVFASSLQGTKYIKREGIVSIAISALFISLSLLTFNLTFSYRIAQEITAPVYEMATLIDYGRYIQRIEPIFLFIWIISSLISATLVFYSFIYIFCKIFKIEDKKPVILAGAVILFAASMVHKDISIIIGYIQSLREYLAIPVFIMPLIVLIIARIRKKGAKKNA
jgi:spore germination protein (amino acid permease)